MLKKAILRTGRVCLERLMLGISAPFAHALSRFVSGNAAYDAFARHGFHLLRKHYYLPIPDKDELATLQGPADLVGVDMNDAAALDLLEHVFPLYAEEFRREFPLHDTGDPRRFHLINGGFMAGDADAYYSFIRHGKPRRIVEIGAGSSTVLAASAVRRNAAEGHPCALVAVEPYPSEVLRGGLPGLRELIVDKLQNVDLGMFTALEAGDILFIDSSHVLRPGGDVQREYCEILPRLAPGVLVHIHDISLPKPYFQFYFDHHLYWNEQYLLQAFLTFNTQYEVVWPGTYMMFRYPDKVWAAFPEIAAMREQFPLAEPSSFWMRVKTRGARS